MNEATALLFDEFATAYRHGEAPDVLVYLERAGDDADALANLIDRFLQAVPARAATEDEAVLASAAVDGHPPILELRVRRAVGRDAVVDALIRALGLDAAKRDKVDRYYHELEIGTLDPRGVDGSVWSTLGDLLKANVQWLARFRPPPPAAMGDAYLRLPDEPATWRAYAAATPAPGDMAAEEPDEIDRLFTGSA